MKEIDRLGHAPFKLSADDVRWLRRVADGDARALPPHVRQRFLDFGLVDSRPGVVFLTPEGRQQLEFRSRETGLKALARRWRDRAEELTVIAERMTAYDGHNLHALAQQWNEIALQLEELERLEMYEPLFGPVIGSRRAKSDDPERSR